MSILIQPLFVALLTSIKSSEPRKGYILPETNEEDSIHYNITRIFVADPRNDIYNILATTIIYVCFHHWIDKFKLLLLVIEER